MKACLATWFHLTGGARVGKQSRVGQPASQSAGGRISGEAASWREAGERMNGYLACKSYSRNTVTRRVHDLDLERGTITVRRGKGDKDRVSVLPERIRAGLTAHLADRRAQFQRDLNMGSGTSPCLAVWPERSPLPRDRGHGSMSLADRISLWNKQPVTSSAGMSTRIRLDAFSATQPGAVAFCAR